MDFIQKKRQENRPIVQLLMIVAYAFAGVTVCSIIAFIVVFAMHGMELFNNPEILTGGVAKYRPVLQIFLFAQSVGLFLVPAFMLSLTEGQRINGFYGFKRPNVSLLVIVLLIMMVSMPVMEWTAAFNQKMVLPDFLKPIENWMRKSEDDLMKTTIFLLKMNNVGDFLINIFLIALVPAVAEELMFRGAIQRSFGRIFNNPHVAIWFSAFIFSAIHMQFYGFLPRFLLGAGFGYLYFWGGSLWYAILGHFLNNAYAVCGAWYMQKNNIPLSKGEELHFAWYGYLISFILTILAFLFFKQQNERLNEQRLD
jgi:membrane protease YdiL (CAAX protease family)